MPRKPQLDINDEPIWECPYCGDRYGRRLDEEWTYCPDCGEKLDWKYIRGEIWFGDFVGDPDAYHFHRDLKMESE